MDEGVADEACTLFWLPKRNRWWEGTARLMLREEGTEEKEGQNRRYGYLEYMQTTHVHCLEIGQGLPFPG